MIRRHRRVPAFLLSVAVLTSCSESPLAEIEPWETAARAAEEAYRSQQFDQAQAGFQQALQLAEASGNERGRFSALEGLAASYAVAGSLDAADSLYSILLVRQQAQLAADSLSGMVLVRTLGSLGEINLGRGDVVRAEAYFASILQLDRMGTVDLRPEEPALAYVLQGLGQIRASRGDSAAADSLLARALGLRLYGQGFSLYVGDDLERAEDAWRQALAQQQSALGAHEDVARTAHALGRLLALRGVPDEAVAQYRQALDVHTRAGSSPRLTAAVLEDLANLVVQQDPVEGDSLRRRAAHLRQQTATTRRGNL